MWITFKKSSWKILKKYLPSNLQRDKNCNSLDLAGLIGKAISISKDDDNILELLTQLDIDRIHILNPLSHNDDRQIYQSELKDAINTVEKLKLAFANCAKSS